MSYILLPIQILIHGAYVRSDRRSGKDTAEDLDHQGERVPFVASYGEYGSEQSLRSVGCRLAIGVERPALRNRLFLSVRSDDVASRDD